MNKHYADLPFKERLPKITKDAREAYATDLFEIDTIVTKIRMVASEGYDRCRIVQERPILLKDTDAFRKLSEWLHSHNLKTEWATRIIAANDRSNPFGVETRLDELVIKW